MANERCRSPACSPARWPRAELCFARFVLLQSAKLQIEKSKLQRANRSEQIAKREPHEPENVERTDRGCNVIQCRSISAAQSVCLVPVAPPVHAPGVSG